MGLDITVYTDLEFVKDPIEDEDYDNYLILHQPDFDRGDGLEPGCYDGNYGFHFRAGSYSSYNAWRAELSYMAHDVDPAAMWGDRYSSWDGKPFAELINFSDCEGFIGPKTSAKLAQDFDDYADRARKFWDDDEYSFSKYESWQEAFHEAAKSNGAVVFG